MNLLFVHDAEKIKEDKDGNLYTDSSYNRDVWNRYLSICDNLSVIFRKESQIYETNYAKQKFEYFDKEKINFISVFNLNSSVFSYLSPKKRIRNNRIIREAIIQNDCLIARLPSSAGYKAIKYAKNYNKPYLVEVVACPWDALWNYSFKGKLIALPNYLFMKRAVKDASYVIYVTNEFLQRRYPTNGKNTSCSNVVLVQFDDDILKARLERISTMSENSKIIIGTAAAVNVRYKGQQYVIKALGELKKQGIINYEYQLVGGGDQTYLKSVAKKYNVTEQVKFLGSLPHDEVFKWLDSIDIYVQPSRQEGLPRALIEAMSRGLPAFGAKTGGIPELLDKKYLFSNTRRNIKEICRILQNITKEDMLIQAKRNFEEAKKYDKTIIERRRQNFFREFINDCNK